MDKEYVITYFIPDERKSGGEYYTKGGMVKKIREIEGEIVMEDETVISVGDIIGVDSEIFRKAD